MAPKTELVTRLSRQCAMRVEQQAGTAAVSFRGDIDLACENGFRVELAKLLQGAPDALRVDLREVEFIDSTGLRMLLELRNRTADEGIEASFIVGDGHVRRILSETGLDAILPVSNG